MGDQEVSKCDFCHEVKPVERTYLKPSLFIKPEYPNNLKLYNEGDYFMIVYTCHECGVPKQ